MSILESGDKEKKDDTKDTQQRVDNFVVKNPCIKSSQKLLNHSHFTCLSYQNISINVKPVNYFV